MIRTSRAIAVSAAILPLAGISFSPLVRASMAEVSPATHEATVPAAQDVIPERKLWENNMLQYAEQHWSQFTSRFEKVKRDKATGIKWDDTEAFNHALADSYYDLPLVMHQIAEYTGDKKWAERAQKAVEFWRDYYVLPNNGTIQGYWNFSHGLATDFKKTGDSKSKEAVILLAKNAAFARDTTSPNDHCESAERSREVAYTIVAYLDAESVGAPRRPRLKALVDNALGHIDQWLGVSPWVKVDDVERDKYVRPFMVALTARALIMYDDKVGDPRIKPALVRIADHISSKMWRSADQAFAYTERVVDSPSDTDSSPDLNLLVAPMYGWLYAKTGEERFKIQGDDAFAGGARKAWLKGDFGKQFNQSYIWSFDYIKWRSAR